MSHVRRALCLVIALALAGCPTGEVDDDSVDPPGDDDATNDDDATADDEDDVADDDDDSAEPLDPNWSHDIASTTLAVDLAQQTVAATVELWASDDEVASFEVGDLEILSATGPDGDLDLQRQGGLANVTLPTGDDLLTLQFEVRYTPHDGFDGADPDGFSFLWPYYCGNLFPSQSEPADGLTFELEVAGVGDDVVVAAGIPTDAPAYQVAWAAGEYERTSLGSTTDGTEVVVWYLAGNLQTAIEGTEYLLATFEWMEQTLGAYPFGSEAGTVELDWGAGGYGGMEHHPLWHVGSYSLPDRSVHVHEAAHGWYGGGIRIECWEDFVLSEGTVTYLTARAIGQAVGPVAESEVWDVYADQLDYILNFSDGIAWPDSCGELDVLDDGIFSLVPYIKGAYFFSAVADEVGAETLDGVLASFYLDHVNGAARMQDMLDHILAETGFDATDLAEDWLRSLGAPDDIP